MTVVELDGSVHVYWNGSEMFRQAPPFGNCKTMKRKTVIIWESTETIAGGTVISLEIYKLLKDRFRCVFFVPSEGEQSRFLQGQNIEYKVMNMGNYSKSKKNAFDVIKFIYYIPILLFKTFRYVQKNDVALIYSNAVRYAIWSSVIGRVMAVPVIWHIHHYFNDYKARMILNVFGRMKSIRKIVFISLFVQNQFPKLSGKATLIYNGVDIQKLQQQGQLSSYKIKKKLQLNASLKIISIVTHIMPTKRQDVLLMAIPLILKQYRDVHFVIAGNVIDEAYNNELRLLVDQMGVSDYVSFIGHCSDVPGFFKDVYLNVVTSIEGLGLILLESLAMGVPCILPNIGGGTEIYSGQGGSLVYPLYDVEKLAEHILVFLQDESIYHNMHEKCEEWISMLDIQRFRKRIGETLAESMLS